MAQATKRQFSVNNNVKLKAREGERCRYVFVDSVEHRADRILMGSLIPTSFEPTEARESYGGYELRICNFKSLYENWFLCCMSDLEWVLQVEGGYVQACEKLLGASAVIGAELSKLARSVEEEAPFVPTAGLRLLEGRAATD